VKNTGKSDLNITGIQAACNCVTLKTPGQKIKPGMEALVELTYQPRVLGDQTEAVSILSNDVVSPPVKVSLKAKVVASLTAKSVIKESSNEVPFK
jgi:Protein of unknown function (DUF1573)